MPPSIRPSNGKRPPRQPVLKVDAERYPRLQKHPELERALRIRQALLMGHSRDDAVALTQQAMGTRAPHLAQAAHPKEAKSKKAAKTPLSARKPARRT